MEDVFLKFPHLSEEIFKSSGNQNLVKCIEVSRMWCNYLEVQKFVQIRIIESIVMQFNEVEEIWNNAFKDTSTETIIELRLGVQEFYKAFEDKLHNNYGVVCLNHGLSPIHIAAGVSNINLLKKLQGKTTDKYPKNQEGWTPLHIAAGYGNLKTFKTIFEEVENKNPSADFGLLEKNCTPLHSIAARGHFKMFKLVIKKIEDINPSTTNGLTPFNLAAYNGHFKICRLMMDRLEEINPGNIINGYSPFHSAAQGGQIEICKFFLKHLGNKNPGLNNGWTPFLEAAQFGQLEVCKPFMEEIDETNPITNDGITVLHAAAIGGYSNVYEFLMKKFSDTNPSTIDGWTPLHAATAHGHLEVCEMILQNIQDIQGIMVECNGKTPLALASDYKHLICMLLINSHIQSLVLKDIQNNQIEFIFPSERRLYDSFPDFTPSSDINNWCLTDSQH